MEIKLKWKVDSIPTGRYSSFETRAGRVLRGLAVRLLQ